MTRGRKALALVLLAALAAGGYAAFTRRRESARLERFDAARLLYERGEYAAAADAFGALARGRPAGAVEREAAFRRALSLEAGGQWARAEASWRENLAEGAQALRHDRARLGLARAAFSTGRLRDAAERIDAVLAARPGAEIEAEARLMRAEIFARHGNDLEAWREAQEIVDGFPGSAAFERARELAGDRYIRLLFSRRVIPGTEEYAVGPGDSIQAIARRFGTTEELIRAMNRDAVRGDLIRAGDRLKVCTERFSAVVDTTANTLTLMAGDRAVKVYRVGTGREGSTPLGEFTIVNKVERPEWYRPGGGVIPYREPEGPDDVPENLLGTRWMGFDLSGYGIHGTWEPETIGRQASAGCIRLLNEDVEELYAILPVGASVAVN